MSNLKIKKYELTFCISKISGSQDAIDLMWLVFKCGCVEIAAILSKMCAQTFKMPINKTVFVPSVGKTEIGLGVFQVTTLDAPRFLTC